jgi:hypothetical protein
MPGSRSDTDAMKPYLGKDGWGIEEVDKTRYEGNFKDGLPHGQGTKKWSSGDCYEGEWRNGARHGTGKATYTSGAQYSGDFEDGLFQGKGRFTWQDGTYYEGEWSSGREHGHGLKQWPDAESYRGGWRSGLRHGCVPACTHFCTYMLGTSAYEHACTCVVCVVFLAERISTSGHCQCVGRGAQCSQTRTVMWAILWTVRSMATAYTRG